MRKLILVVLLAASCAPAPSPLLGSPSVPPTVGPAGPTFAGASSTPAWPPSPSDGQPAAAATPKPTAKPTPKPTLELADAVAAGIAAYAKRSHGSRYLAIPEGPGHRVRICASEHPDRCLPVRTSTDAGPDLEMQRAGRVADLSFVDFAYLCRCDPTIRGTMPVEISYLGGHG